jgi:hypothetical protein
MKAEGRDHNPQSIAYTGIPAQSGLFVNEH